MTAFIFVPLFVLSLMIFYIVAIFAAQYFLTLVESTALGQRVIEWPKEQFTEWLGMPVRLAWLAGPCLLPAVILSGIIVKHTGQGAYAIAITGAAFALLFPFSAVSAALAGSGWVPIHPLAPAKMLAKPGALVQFYVVALAAAGLGMCGFFLAVFSNLIGLAGAFVGSIAAALGWFLYACAVGRLLYVVTWQPPVKRKDWPEVKSELYTHAPPPLKKLKKKKMRPVQSPEGPVEGYGVADDVPAVPDAAEVPGAPRPKPHWDPDFDDAPYAAFAPEPVADDGRKAIAEQLVKPKESEMKLLEKDPPPPPPDRPFGRDAFAPMEQTETMRNVLLLAVMFGIMSGLVRALFDLNPNR